METLYRKTEKPVLVLELIFKLLFITYGFLQASSITFGNKIISVVLWPTIALGGLLILYRFLFFKKYKDSTGIYILIFFAVSYAISSIFMRQYGVSENFRYLVFLTLQFGMLYAYKNGDCVDKVKKHFQICMQYVCLVTAVLALTSFVLMFSGYNKAFVSLDNPEAPPYYIGFANGRLYGAYWDPNIGALTAVVVILLSVYFIIKHKHWVLKTLHALNLTLQVCYVAFSDSRTGRVALLTSVFCLSVFLLLKKVNIKKLALKVVCIIAASLVIAVAAYELPAGIQSGYNLTVQSMMKDDGNVDSPDKPNSLVIERGGELETDPSNRRFDIWESAVDIFKSSPIYGASRGNLLKYVEAELPTSYLITNDYIHFSSMHNVFFEILASQGILGIVPFLAFALLIVIHLFRNRKLLFESEEFSAFAAILACMVAVCTASMFIIEIVYVVSPASSVFWIGLGYMNKFISSKNGDVSFIKKWFQKKKSEIRKSETQKS